MNYFDSRIISYGRAYIYYGPQGAYFYIKHFWRYRNITARDAA